MDSQKDLEVSLEKDKTYLVAGGYPTDTFRPTKMTCPTTLN